MSERSHDIEKYLRGELTPAEMHALEKRALDDPFLADALEGAAQIDDKALSADLNALGKALSERVSEKKVIPLWVWTARIAAGLALIGLSTFVVINLTSESKVEQIAESKKQDTTQNSPAGEAASLQPDSTPQGRDLIASNDSDSEEEKPTAAPPKKETPAGAPPATAKPEQKQEQVSKLSADQSKTEDATPAIAELADPIPAEKENVLPADKIEVAKDKEAAKRKATTIASAPASTADGYLSKGATNDVLRYNTSDSLKNRIVTITKVTGRVTSSDDGSGLPGVNVVIKGTSTGTVTDINGNYQIEIPDPYSTLVYSFIGLESAEMPVNNSPTVNMTMQQDVSQLSEVVVTGFGEKEPAPSYSTFQMAEPAGGRRAFKKYLEEKLIYPQQAIVAGVEGRVTIQFTVETSGKLTDFNIVKGLGYGCDEEVIRLIKQGPKWAPMKRNDELVKGRVRVRMRFTLPKKK